MGGFDQIFRLLGAADALEALALGYAAQAAQCILHGDDNAAARHLQRASDATAALRLITDLRTHKTDRADYLPSLEVIINFDDAEPAAPVVGAHGIICQVEAITRFPLLPFYPDL